MTKQQESESERKQRMNEQHADLIRQNILEEQKLHEEIHGVSKIHKAVELAIETHETRQKQKRKGKDIPYIVHPLTVGLFLAHAKASSDVICAGILHDAVEDSAPDHKVSVKLLEEKFNEKVADLVESVTESDKSLSWKERKIEAQEHIKTFDNDALLIKSADILSNGLDLIKDHERNGDKTFNRFNAPKDQLLNNQRELIELILKAWPDSPLAMNLKTLLRKIQKMT